MDSLQCIIVFFLSVIIVLRIHRKITAKFINEIFPDDSTTRRWLMCFFIRITNNMERVLCLIIRRDPSPQKELIKAHTILSSPKKMQEVIQRILRRMGTTDLIGKSYIRESGFKAMVVSLIPYSPCIKVMCEFPLPNYRTEYTIKQDPVIRYSMLDSASQSIQRNRFADCVILMGETPVIMEFKYIEPTSSIFKNRYFSMRSQYSDPKSCIRTRSKNILKALEKIPYNHHIPCNSKPYSIKDVARHVHSTQLFSYAVLYSRSFKTHGSRYLWGVTIVGCGSRCKVVRSVWKLNMLRDQPKPNWKDMKRI